MSLSPSDARLVVLRSLRALFLDVLAADGGKGRSAEEQEQDERYAEELGLEVLETLGLFVESVDEDGSMVVRLRPE